MDDLVRQSIIEILGHYFPAYNKRFLNQERAWPLFRYVSVQFDMTRQCHSLMIHISLESAVASMETSYKIPEAIIDLDADSDTEVHIPLEVEILPSGQSSIWARLDAVQSLEPLIALWENEEAPAQKLTPLEGTERAKMEAYITKFIGALERELIVPEDF